MRVRPHAQLYDIEMRQIALFQREEFPDVRYVVLRRALRRDASFDAVNVARRKVRRTDQRFLSQLVVAFRVGGRHGAFIYPEQVHAVPAIAGLHQRLKQQLRRAAAGNGHSGSLFAGQHIVEQHQNVPGRRLGRRSGIGIGMPVNAHDSSTSLAARARLLSKIGSRPGMDSSSRSRT